MQKLLVTPRKVKKSLAHKSGRKNGSRIQLIINKSDWTLKRISDSVSIESDTINQDIELIVSKIYRRNLIDTLKGNRNTPHYILALEKCWLLPIEKIRELYQLDLIGEPSAKERLDLSNYYDKILSEARKDGRYINPRLSVAILSLDDITQIKNQTSQSSHARNGNSHPNFGIDESFKKSESQSSHARKGNSHRKWSAKFDWKSKRASQSSHARNGNSHH